MKKHLAILFLFFLTFSAHAQTINWQNTIGGESSDRLRAIEKTFDGHFIIGGTSTSGIAGDKTEENRFIADPPIFFDEPRGYTDFWVMKINKNTGAIMWQKTVGGSYADNLRAIKHTADGGYLLAGTTVAASNYVSGERTASPLGEIGYYNADIWLVKLDAFGDVVWDKTHGSAKSDSVLDMVETHDGGYLMVGSIVSEDASGTDILIIKIDASGNEQWQKSIVGNNYDSGISAVKTSDNGFVIIASSNSGISNDKTSENEGGSDFWVLKIDNQGNIIWQRNIGGEVNDDPVDIIATSDGNFLITGASDSYISGDKTENAICNSRDAWIVKIDKEGNILWDKTIGGDNWDWFSDVIETEDGGFLLGGVSSSNISGYKTESTRVENDFVRCCLSDFWIVKIDKNGNFKFDKTIGGYGGDSINAMLQLDDGSYVLAGDSVANISGEKTESSQGSDDYWIVNIDIGDIDTPVNIAPSFNELLVCEGEMVQLSAVEGQSYSWSGPNGYSSTDQNPFINSVSSQNAGTYNGITYFLDGCIETKIIDLSMQNCTQTNMPPEITASGDQSYCFGNPIQIATDFDITDPDDTGIDAFFIQISEGYTFDEDVLILTGNHPNITSSWDPIQGKLSFFSATASANMLYSDLISAVRDVVYSATTNTEQVDKIFSFTIGDANFLPSTGHFYEYVPDFGITWSQARAAAAARTYFGLQGYLVTVTTPEEAQITGEQAAGAGWIGGTDAATEGVWMWVTGPEAGTVFWTGGVNGTTPNFANWNFNEPNNFGGNEDFAHITSPNIGNLGSWNDLPLAGDPDVTGDFHPQGYVVEYGGMPGDPMVTISASTKISFPSITSPIESQEVCGAQRVSLEAIPNDGAILWYDSIDAPTPVFTGNSFTTPVIQNTTSYYATVSINGCSEGERIEFPIIVNPLPQIEPMITYRNCDVDGIADGFTDFNLEEVKPVITNEAQSAVSITFHDTAQNAEHGDDAITDVIVNNQNTSTIYARVEFIESECFEVSTINLEVSTTAFPNDYLYNIENCDTDGSNDGISEFNFDAASQDILNQFPMEQNLSVAYYRNATDAQLQQNEITNKSVYVNDVPFLETLYVRVESIDNGNCFGIGPHVVLTVHPIPEFEIAQSETFCLGGAPVTLAAINASDSGLTYQWSDSSGNSIGTSDTIEVSSAGTYSAVATSEENCQSESISIELKTSERSTITMADIAIMDVSNNNTLTIDETAIGIGDYEYALNDEFGTYQDNTVLSNVPAGEHILYVRDKNGCGITSLSVFVMGIPKFFTPNGDNVNDTWNIKGLSDTSRQNTKIYIYNRYGKLLKQFTASANGWNGTLNGRMLAADDYWYVVNLVDATENTITYTGHFSLIR